MHPSKRAAAEAPAISVILVFSVALSTFLPADAAAAKFHVDLNGDEETTAPRAQDDFYLSQNFDWMKASTIPESKSSIGTVYSMDRFERSAAA
jgi:hypothetical protein